jgi:hypothetical protein
MLHTLDDCASSVLAPIIDDDDFDEVLPSSLAKVRFNFL